MEEVDYEKLGLRVGFEIHQELETHKLFCNCPSDLKDEEPPLMVKRRLQPTQSELGEIDRAALAEEAKSKSFRYEVHPESVCLVELDEEPPHPLNREALDIALEIALLLDAQPVDEAHVMRKTVIDGSNTAGFQRTVLIARDGRLKMDGKEVGLPTICLEEDAARKIEESQDFVKYRLDRLGIPLLEIATDPEFSDPETATRAALKIGRILRATEEVKRGIGTIRQDVNVSIEDGARQEIKGVQELSLISTVIEKEVQRQIKLLEIKEELEKRNTPKSEKEIFEVTDIFSDTDSKIIKNSPGDGGVFAVVLKGFNELLKEELEPDRRFGTELSDYARVFGKVEGIFHTDELPGYGISEEEVSELRESVKASKNDAVVVVAEEENKARKALEAVVNRANKAFEGVPEETRRALPDGNTQYMRPLPGAARMYVETDVPPLPITEEMLEKTKSKLPEKPDEKRKRYIEKYGLSEEIADQMSISGKGDLFEEIVGEHEVDPTLVATTLEQKLTQLEREGISVSNISEESLRKIFELVSEEEISKDALLPILEEIGKGSEVEGAIDKLGIQKMGKEKVSEIVSEVVENKRELVEKRGKKAIDALMGIAMQKIGGKADGKLVHRMLEEKIDEILS
ncbi:glutamyl-tRNA amidotransferase [candidate division MSBL1 archaeon SCGC-AAA259M10]|uniref:Glutamyl-tRNA(Gln) amidotransferase subunit E n=3 Tax=candidate division MSBL1 TaxID=215777 RepID=A0A133V5P7_9EURY|nr:glutamyl-tRNA amidotransferase [candidate division MSBL1 archaeon SCGC-AAA259E19]KXA98926.1 glutamyl-tRNA amidotransferase [candidate division MSBL1 archaeon SCGC-AAA259M10]KXB01764.1 glutamyl-tRNA amidotransferase [candidate division MSBL1 archaeon SCGC-AAA259O05]